jgi:hypothetical protein
MKRQLVLGLVTVAASTFAFAGGEEKKSEEQAQQQQQSSEQLQQQEQLGTGGSGMQDMSKVGPWTRKPTDEKKSKQEIQAMFKQDEEAWKSGNFDASLANVDFPVLMVTDDTKGKTHAQQWSREQWVQMMQPMMQQMPKDMQIKHNYTINVLSDSLATYSDDFTMKTGGKSYSGRNSGTLVKADGKWKWKSIVEAGWGEMAQQGVGGAGMEGMEGMEGTGGSGMEGAEGTDQGEPHPDEEKRDDQPPTEVEKY